MSILKKIRHKAQTAKEKPRKTPAANRKPAAERRTDQVTGEASQAADKVKDAFRH